MMQFDHPNLVKAYHYVTWGTAGYSRHLTCSVSYTVAQSLHAEGSEVSVGPSYWAPSAGFWCVLVSCVAGQGMRARVPSLCHSTDAHTGTITLCSRSACVGWLLAPQRQQVLMTGCVRSN